MTRDRRGPGLRHWRERGQPAVAVVTRAPQSRVEEINDRRRRYMWTMGVRTLLFVLAVFLFHGWLRFVAIAASLLLPQVAVILANAGPKYRAPPPGYDAGGGRRQLEAGPVLDDGPVAPPKSSP